MPASLKVSANSSGVNGGGGMAARSRGSSGGDRPTVAVVLSGAVARGAFQAGALAELVPALERDGLTPTVWLGTSAGSINAVLWGSAAHRDAATVAEEVLGVWRRMSDDDVVRPLLPFSLPRVGLQFATGAVFGVGPGTTSLLDTGPLRETAEEVLETGQLAANIADGVLDAVGAVATRMPRDSDYVVTGAASGRSVLFLDEHSPGDYAGDQDRALDVVRSPVTVEHVLASSAVPVAFPRSGSPGRIRRRAGTWTAAFGSTPPCAQRSISARRGSCSSRRMPRGTGRRRHPTRRARPRTSLTRPPRSCVPCWPIG